MAERRKGKKTREILLLNETIEEAHPLRFIFFLEDPVAVRWKIADFLLRKKLYLFLEKERFVLALVEENDPPVRDQR